MSKPAEVIPGVYHLKVPIPDNPLGYLNCYVLRGKEGWLMVDTGWYTQEAFRALEDQLKALGSGVEEIRQIVVTHMHPDHYGLAGWLIQLSGARLAMHHWEKALIESRYLKYDELLAQMAVIMRRNGVPEMSLPRMQRISLEVLGFVLPAMPHITLFGGETLSSDGFSLEVVWTPGHSPGHICLYAPEKKLFFSGDHILPVITPNISYHAQSGDNPLGDYIASLKKLENLEVSLVLPAHEHTFSDLRGRIAQILHHHEERKEAVLQAMRGRPLTAWDISPLIPWNTGGVPWEKLGALDQRIAVTETMAHLIALRYDGRVQKLERDGVFYYALL